jgi:asparagine synthetase B (glutamine-hydrolysing)
MTAIDFGDTVEALTESGAPSFLALYRRKGADRPSLELLGGHDEGVAALAADERHTVILAGALVDRDLVVGRVDADPDVSDAELVLKAYVRLGEAGLGELRGAFALLIHDAEKDALLFLRDQLGHYPLFYAEGHEGVYFSEAITTLVRHPQVPGGVNRAVIAELLIHELRSPDETAFEAVYRARAGWRYRVTRTGTEATRYWFPIPPDGSGEWATEEELPQFDGLMRRAVARSLEPGATGIFLSGGLDSVTVATYAADLLRDAGEQPLRAFSIVFPEYDETSVQKLVAGELGLPHELVPFGQAIGSESLVRSAVRSSGSWPMPLVNLWQPLYTHLALLARGEGVRRILTGAGGDEWLQVSPHWGFSRLRRLHIGEMRHLYRTYLRSYNLERGPLLKNLLWKYGLRHTLRDAALNVLGTAMPPAVRAIKLKRFRERRPAWLAPDPELARALEERAMALAPATNPAVAYGPETYSLLENPIGAMEREEAFERGRRLGMATFMPFWDVDLDEFLARVPPHLMNQGYWSKGLVRGKLAERFPEAGFDQQKKVLSTSLAARILAEETPPAWRAIDGPKMLAAAGVIDKRRLELEVEGTMRHDSPTHHVLGRAIAGHGMWTVLNVESWFRQWS